MRESDEEEEQKMITTSGSIDVELSRWNIVINLITGDEHFLGYDDNLKTSRFSSPIIYFDDEAGVGITFSQRVYRTIGPPGNFCSETIYHLNKISKIRRMNYKIKYPILAKNHVEILH